MTTRSAVLYAGHPEARAQEPLITVPSGFRYIVKSVAVTLRGANPDGFILFVYRPSNGTNVNLLDVAGVEPNAPERWDGWLMLDTADQLYLYYTLGPFHLWVSGTELLLP